MKLTDQQVNQDGTTGAPGRVGYDAYGDARGWRVFNGGPMPTWEQQTEKTPDIATAWVAAGQAERAVAYALAADTANNYGSPAVTSPLAERIRELAQPPANVAERMARLAALLREAGAIAGEVAADADAPAELRASAVAIHGGVFGNTGEPPTVTGLRCWEVRRKLGPLPPDARPTSAFLHEALLNTRSALANSRNAARSSSSLPLGRTLGLLEAAEQQLGAALKLDPVTPPEQVDSTLVPPSPQRERRPTPTPDGVPIAVALHHMSVGPEGMKMTPAVIMSTLPEDEAEKTPTSPSEPLKDSDT